MVDDNANLNLLHSQNLKTQAILKANESVGFSLKVLHKIKGGILKINLVIDFEGQITIANLLLNVRVFST